MRALALLFLLAACGDTGQKVVAYPLTGQGGSAQLSAGRWQLTFDEARLALGPIYFCATAAASSDLCPVAVNELADVVVLDGLGGAGQPLGTIRGTTGGVRSAAYDLGINWFATQRMPTPHPAAPGGHAARFGGSASDGSTSRRFTAEIDVAPQFAGELAVRGVAVQVEITPATAGLSVAVDATELWRAVDLDALFAAPGDVTVLPGSRAHDALVFALTAGAPFRFTWQ
jgi:hypothetical protein